MSARMPATRWKFIDTSDNPRSNLTQAKRHVMKQYLRQKRQDEGAESAEPAVDAQSARNKSSEMTICTSSLRPSKRTPAQTSNLLSRGILPGQLDYSPALRRQLVSVFLDAYLPSVTNPFQRVGGDFTGALPFRLGDSPMLDYAIVALCAVYVGSSWTDTLLYREGVESYARAVQCLRGCFERSSTSQHMLYVIAALQTYEVLQPSQQGMLGWSAHVHGCRALLGRGRDDLDSALNDDELYRHMQMVIIAEAIVHRTSAHVPNPAWQPQARTMFDEVLDILVSCTTVMAEIRQLEQDSGEDKHTAGHHVLDQCVRMEGQLDAQYSMLRSRVGFPDLWEAGEADTHECVEPDELFFGDAFCFPSFPVAQVHSLHWATRLLMNMCVERLCCILGELFVPGPPLPQSAECSQPAASNAHPATASAEQFPAMRSYEDLINSASFSATMVCRSVRYCLSPGMNAFGVQVLFVRLWLANEFYHGRHGFEKEYAWCQKIIHKITSTGFQGAPDFMGLHWPPLPSLPEDTLAVFDLGY